jgi:hypothetical protein
MASVKPAIESGTRVWKSMSMSSIRTWSGTLTKIDLQNLTTSPLPEAPDTAKV